MKETDIQTKAVEKKWYKKMPNAYVILFFMLILMSVLTYIIPSGEFDRVMMDNGRIGVVVCSFHFIKKTKDMTVSLWDMFAAIPKGMTEAANVMMIVFFAGGS